MKTLIDVEPFAFTYRIFDREARKYYGDFSSMEELLNFANQHRIGSFSNGDLNKREVNFWFQGRPVWKVHHEPRYTVIRVEDNYALTAEEVQSFRKYKFRNSDYGYDRDVDLIFVKANPKKIKKLYRAVRRNWGGRTGDFIACLDMHLNSRNVHTQQELIKLNAIEDEYGDEFNLIRRGRLSIPTRYDDPRNTSWHHRKSWKRHSKRRKQWIPR